MDTTQDDTPESPEELAILVHGTFAGDDADTGSKWWQSGSQEALELQRRFPGNVRVATGAEVFHWSGDNGERARGKAALQLLEHLKPLEQQGRSYHLVGHSHGGSVIWNALQAATYAGKSLPGLKSWTTVGTPFLHQSSRRPWHVMNLLGFVLGLALLKPAFAAARETSVLLWDAARGLPIKVMLPSDEQAGYLAVLRAPFLALGKWLGMPIVRTDQGIHLGSFDPAGDLSLVQYLFTTREGLILMSLLVICFYFFLHLASMCLRPVIESIRIQAETRLQRRAFDRYGPRWLGLWSPDDEAINGLRATLDLSMTFVKKIAPGDRVFFTDHLALISRPYYWVLAPIFNRFLRPAIDSLVRGVLIRAAQGNDRPTAHVVAVLPAPIAEVIEAPPLPKDLQDKIRQQADQHAGGVAPKLRQLLANPSFTSGLEAFAGQLSGKELVHTSYFDHPEVLDLISCNLAWHNNGPEAATLALQKNPTLLSWFEEFKSLIATDDPGNSTTKKIAPAQGDIESLGHRKAA